MTNPITNNRRTLYVIVPVLNEAPNLPRLFNAFQRLQSAYPTYDKQIILIDDGSTDDTASVARELGTKLQLTVISHDGNKGPGYAFGTAFAFLADRLCNDDWVLTLEGDNTSRLELLSQMFHRADEGYDVILASPYLYGGGIVNTVPLRVLLSKAANLFVKEILGLEGLVTVSSFYRLYRGSAILALQRIYGERIIERTGFECMVEMLMKMVFLHTSISEVAMVLDSSVRIGKSKMKIMRTMRGYLALYRQMDAWKSRSTHVGVANTMIGHQTVS